MLILNNDDVQQVLDIRSCMEALEAAYADLADGFAGHRPRLDFYVPQEPHYYRWGTMEGASRKLGVLAIRMKSDMLVWNRKGDRQTESKYCIEPGTYCGLVFLLSVRNGEPLALMNDGYLQHLRVGACAGLGVKYLSRPDSRVLGMVGSGGMAHTYAAAIREVRPIRRMRVFSPTKSNREAFAREMSAELGIETEPVDSPEQAVRGADIVALATSSLVPILRREWLEPGMHVTNVRPNEVSPEILEGMDVVVRLGTTTIPWDDPPADIVRGSDGTLAYFVGTAEERSRLPFSPAADPPDSGGSTLPEVIAGRRAGRTGDSQITFFNNLGTQGLQFAAAGARVYELAKERGLGRELPTQWFVQNIRD